MKSLLYLLLGLALCLPLFAETSSERAKRADEFAKKELHKVMELFRAGKRAEALDQVDEGLRLSDDEFGTEWYFHKRVWSEAQIHSGDKDEAWGLDLFLRLLAYSEEKSNDRGSELDYLLHLNIGGALRSVGRITEARELVAREQASLETYARMDTVNRPYKDLGPLFTFLPDARKRKFPVYGRDVNRRVRAGELLPYPRIYAVYDIASAALDTGDWVKAAELYRWVADYAAVYCLRDIPRVREVSRHAMYAYTEFAEICTLHGYTTEADAMYTEFLTLASVEGYPGEAAALATAKLDQLVLRTKLGTLPEDAIELAEECSKTIGGYTYFGRPSKFKSRLKVARIHYAKGNRARAWEIIAELSAEAEADVNPHYRMFVLAPKIDFALAEGGTHPELEEWLVRSLNFERSMGNKFNELPLYEKYAEFLILNGRLSEAVAILEEAIRLSVAMNVPFRAEKNRELLRSIKLRVEEVSKKVDLKTDPDGSTADVPGQGETKPEGSANNGGLAAEEARMVDLQPMSSRSTVVPGSTAYTRFYLTNPSTGEKTGRLKMTGPIASDSSPGAGQLSVVLDAAIPAIAIERAFVLAPGVSIAVDVAGGGASEEVETEFSCVWLEDGADVSEAIWLYKSSDVATRMSVVDAHAVKISPFHLIPIRHMIQRNRVAGSSENVDFKIAASEPMRIEVYDASGTKLIAVDANGDGDFQDKGDLVYQDLNGNGHPDLTMAESETLASLTMYVDPVQIEPNDSNASREVTISVLQDGQWHEDAVDVIK